MKLYTSEEDLKNLSSVLDNSRKSSIMVSVCRKALSNLVCDVGTIIDYAKKHEKIIQKGDA
jgi:hypothetical protein